MASRTVSRSGGRRLRTVLGWVLLIAAAFAALPFTLLAMVSPTELSLWAALVATIAVALAGGRLAFGD